MEYIVYFNQTYLWTEETEEKIRTICELWLDYFDYYNNEKYPLISKGWTSKAIKDSCATKHTFKIVRKDSFNVSKKNSREISYTIYNFANVDETLAYALENYQEKYLKNS